MVWFASERLGSPARKVLAPLLSGNVAAVSVGAFLFCAVRPILPLRLVGTLIRIACVGLFWGICLPLPSLLSLGTYGQNEVRSSDDRAGKKRRVVTLAMSALAPSRLVTPDLFNYYPHMQCWQVVVH